MDLDLNPDSIRGTEESDALCAIVQADLDAQAQNVRDMRASGEVAVVNRSDTY